MISPAAYMEPIVAWNRLCGSTVVRGASGEKGREAAQELVKKLKGGESVYLAVDGPKGPALEVKRGCIDMAMSAGVPIIPVGYRCKRAKFNPYRWDHWLMVGGFDRVTISYGAPIFLAPGTEVEEAKRRVKEGLSAICNSLPNP
jgi:lysophospholipid acyltransferase (LPLAT)-like uncharacterized protein